MNGRSPHTQRSPAFIAWLVANPTGIPRRQAARLAALGLLLGLLGGGLVSWFSGVWHAQPLWQLSLGIASGAVSGATLGALAVVLIARVLDGWMLTRDRLIGYSGVVRMLLHAGELSFLGALAGGMGGGAAGTLAGLLTGALGGGIAGGLIYRIRGLGTFLGLTVGIVAGAVGGAIGGAVVGLGGP